MLSNAYGKHSYIEEAIVLLSGWLELDMVGVPGLPDERLNLPKCLTDAVLDVAPGAGIKHFILYSQQAAQPLRKSTAAELKGYEIPIRDSMGVQNEKEWPATGGSSGRYGRC